MSLGDILAVCAIILFVAIDVWIVLDEMFEICLPTDTFLTLTWVFFGLVILAIMGWLIELFSPTY